MSALFRVFMARYTPCRARHTSVLCRHRRHVHTMTTANGIRYTADTMTAAPPPHGMPPRHDCRNVRTSGRHIPHVLTSRQACRKRSNFHGHTSGHDSGSSSATVTYHQRQHLPGHHHIITTTTPCARSNFQLLNTSHVHHHRIRRHVAHVRQMSRHDVTAARSNFHTAHVST